MLRHLLDDTLCRLGFHRFGPPMLADGLVSCYRSVRCRGRAHRPSRGGLRF